MLEIIFFAFCVVVFCVTAIVLTAIVFGQNNVAIEALSTLNETSNGFLAAFNKVFNQVATIKFKVKKKYDA